MHGNTLHNSLRHTRTVILTHVGAPTFTCSCVRTHLYITISNVDMVYIVSA